MKSAEEYRADARASLAGKWGGAVVMTLVCLIISGFVSSFDKLIANGLGTVVTFLLLPMGYSFAVAFLDNKRDNKEYKVGQIFEGFKDYTRIFGTMLLETVYVLLWMLLLIVPGLIKAYSYAMTPYILRDYPELKYNGAIEHSMAMMKGYKGKLFYLHLTFLGWLLLSIVTLGIGLLWLIPYMDSAQAHFYEERKAEFEGEATVQAEEA